MAEDVFTLELPNAGASQGAAELASALQELDGVENASSGTRSLAGALLLVKVVGGALSDVATAVPLVRKVVDLIRGKGVTGARIELPNGTKISVDNASIDEIERLVAAATSAG